MYLIVVFSMSSLRAAMLKENTIFGYRLKDLPNDRSNLEWDYRSGSSTILGYMTLGLSSILSGS